MKKLFTIALVFVFTAGFSQSALRNYNAWKFGLNFGGIWQTADVRSTAGGAGGFTLEKAILENKTHFFSLAIRGRGLFGNTYGLDYSRNYDVKNNDALNGDYNPSVNYNDTSVSRPYIYNNYKTEIAEGALELQVTFNSLRERTNVLLNLWGGIGFTSYRANTNLLDLSGNMYNYSKVDSVGSQSAILSSHKNLLDNTYESYAQGSKHSNIYTLSPSAGIGLGYQFGRYFAIVYEYKVTFPLGMNADYLDGIVGKNNDKIAGSNDYYHYTGVNFLFSFGKGKTKSTRDTTRYTSQTHYQPVHTNTVQTAPVNTIAVNPVTTNEVLPKPIVKFVDPSYSPYSEKRNTNFDVAATVYNVNSRSQIQVTVNGNNYPNFNYASNKVTFPITLNIGNNVIVISATNNAGSDSKTAIINYSGQPPVITYVTPPVNPFSTNVASLDVTATVYNVVSNYDVTVKFNGNPLYNYSYNVASGQFNTQLALVPGLNTLEINATNPFGADNKKLIINYTQPLNTPTAVVTSGGRPVKVTITNPGTANYKTNVNTHNVFATVTGVNSASQATVTVNGAAIPFNYNNGAVNFIANLNEGNNIAVVTGKNSSSSDTKSAILIYEPIKKNPPPSVVITNPQPSPHTTSANSFNFKATTYFVNNINQIEVKYNGVIENNYSFNAASGEVEYNATLNTNANNIFEVKVTNNAGSNSASAVVKQETLANTEVGIDPQITICHNDGSGNRQTITINQSQWAAHQAHGDVMGVCPRIIKQEGNPDLDPDMVICHLDGNGGKQTMNIKQSQWAAHQAHGDVVGECPKVVEEEPVVDNNMTICHKNGDGSTTTMVIKQSQWLTHQAHGDVQGPCPKKVGQGNGGDFDPDVTICHNDGNGGYQTMTVKQSQVAAHQAHGDQMGACPRIIKIEEEEKKIRICHLPPGNPNNPQSIDIPQSAWPAHQAHGDYLGDCNASNPGNSGNNGNSGNSGNNDPDPQITICHIPPGNPNNPQTITIPQSAWPAHQAHGDTKGACAPSNNGGGNGNSNGNGNGNSGNNGNSGGGDPDPQITICHIPPGNPNNPQTITIPQSAWPAHQAHGDTQGACAPSNNGGGNGNGNGNGNSGNNGNSGGGDPDPQITICHIPPGNPNNPQTITIPQSAWAAHQAHGDTKGACAPSNNNNNGNGNGNSGNSGNGGGNNNASKKITICHIPPGNNNNPQTIEIDENAWPAHQAHGDTKGACSQKTIQSNDASSNPPKQIKVEEGNVNPGRPVQSTQPKTEEGTINVGRPR